MIMYWAIYFKLAIYKLHKSTDSNLASAMFVHNSYYRNGYTNRFDSGRNSVENIEFSRL